MPAYMLVQTMIHDEEAFARYAQAVGPLIDRFDGEVVAKTSAPLVLEGDHAWSTAGLLRFETVAAAEKFWHSPAYAELKAMRAGAADLFATVIEAPESTHPGTGSSVPQAVS